jgi:hypothetical protein
LLSNSYSTKREWLFEAREHCKNHSDPARIVLVLENAKTEDENEDDRWPQTVRVEGYQTRRPYTKKQSRTRRHCARKSGKSLRRV